MMNEGMEREDASGIPGLGGCRRRDDSGGEGVVVMGSLRGE